MNKWSYEDPRVEINKRGSIVILRPSLTGYWIAGTGEVETHQGYSIITSFEDYPVIGFSASWDSAWAWIFAPK
jgi:hypothetical protein